ncbi:unnamed protein product, partial [Discosporangium mesarthrocarpum]
GEDGTVRAWTAARGKLCGHKRFVAIPPTTAPSVADTGAEAGWGLGLGRSAVGGSGLGAAKGREVPVPVCVLASCRLQPLLAVGLSLGSAHLLFVEQTSAYDVTLITLWREQLYQGAVSGLSFHPTKPLLAVASRSYRSVHVINFHNTMGDFVVCAVAVPPSGEGGVNGLMWRGNDLIFSTQDQLVCAMAVKAERRCRPNRSDPLLWAFRTPTPLNSMCPHPKIQQGPFFAVSADRRVLQVLPALPEKGVPSTIDEGGVAKPLSPLDTLEAHQKGAAVMAASVDGRFMATGGADGLVCLWAVYEQQVELLNSALVHAGPVISLSFATDSSQLFTASLDGTVFGLTLEGLGNDRGAAGQLPPLVSTLERLAEKKATKPQRISIEQLGQPPWRQEQVADKKGENSKEMTMASMVQRKVVGEFAARLARIVKHNETLPDLEKLERGEFVVDVAGRDRKIAANEAAANALRQRIKMQNLTKELIGARIKAECWDSMEIQAKEVRALQREGVLVENFSIRRRSNEELEQTRKKVKQLRALELRDIRRGKYSVARAWQGLLDEVPSDISWIVNEGKLVPVVDIVQALREEALGGGAKMGSGWGAGGGGEGTGEEGGKNINKNDDEDASGADDEDEDGRDASIDMAVLEPSDENDPTSLLYPPLALRTPRQKRTQIILLQELILDMHRAFNHHFDQLYSAKEDCMDKVEEKNNRVKEILAELDSSETYFQPQWLEQELPSETFDVEGEMTSTPYESEATKEKRRKEDEERKQREEEAKGENSRFRALEDMMHGTLEVKQEGLTVGAVQRPDWMDEVPPEEMTDEQRTEVEAYEAKLKEVQDELAKHRKALELELKKLRTEVI